MAYFGILSYWQLLRQSQSMRQILANPKVATTISDDEDEKHYETCAPPNILAQHIEHYLEKAVSMQSDNATILEYYVQV